MILPACVEKIEQLRPKLSTEVDSSGTASSLFRFQLLSQPETNHFRKSYKAIPVPNFIILRSPALGRMESAIGNQQKVIF